MYRPADGKASIGLVVTRSSPVEFGWLCVLLCRCIAFRVVLTVLPASLFVSCCDRLVADASVMHVVFVMLVHNLTPLLLNKSLLGA
jgi:hypothetical protein